MQMPTNWFLKCEPTKESHEHDCVIISAEIESELVDLSPSEAKEFLRDLGEDSGVSSS